MGGSSYSPLLLLHGGLWDEMKLWLHFQMGYKPNTALLGDSQLTLSRLLVHYCMSAAAQHTLEVADSPGEKVKIVKIILAMRG